MERYLEVQIKNKEEFSEILMAELGEINYDSFVETDQGLNAYILQESFQEEELIQLQKNYQEFIPFEYVITEMENKNWNEEWEKNFKFTEIGDDVIVRADFHKPEKTYKHEIIINPQMSFGTGHHDTTAGVIEAMLTLDFKNKRVLDAGTGTGILAVMAKKLEAKSIFAYDIDEWSFNNSKENFILNNTLDIEIEQGDAGLLTKFGKEFDITLANINKNILLQDIPFFQDHMAENGYLVLSGFYKNDILDLLERCKPYGLEEIYRNVSLNNWTVLVLKKM